SRKFFFSRRRRHTRFSRDWSSDVCSSDLGATIAGDTEHPANFGRLCSKGSALGETLALETRLLHPEIDGQRVTWDAALDHVSSRSEERRVGRVKRRGVPY